MGIPIDSPAAGVDAAGERSVISPPSTPGQAQPTTTRSQARIEIVYSRVINTDAASLEPDDRPLAVTFSRPDNSDPSPSRPTPSSATEPSAAVRRRRSSIFNQLEREILQSQILRRARELTVREGDAPPALAADARPAGEVTRDGHTSRRSALSLGRRQDILPEPPANVEHAEDSHGASSPSGATNGASHSQRDLPTTGAVQPTAAASPEMTFTDTVVIAPIEAFPYPLPDTFEPDSPPAREDVYPLAEVPPLPLGARRTRFESPAPSSAFAPPSRTARPMGPWPLRSSTSDSTDQQPPNVAPAPVAESASSTALSIQRVNRDTDRIAQTLSSVTSQIHEAMEQRVAQARSDLDVVRGRLAMLDRENRELERNRLELRARVARRTEERSSWTIPAEEDEDALQVARTRERLQRFSFTSADRTRTPTETETALRRAREALRTAVTYAERLELVTRTMTSLADSAETTRARRVNSAADRASGLRGAFPPAASASIQRSVDQLRAAESRIAIALSEHVAARAATAGQDDRASSSSSSDATATAPTNEPNADSLTEPLLGSAARLNSYIIPSDDARILRSRQIWAEHAAARPTEADTLSPANPPPRTRSAYAPFVPPSVHRMMQRLDLLDQEPASADLGRRTETERTTGAEVRSTGAASDSDEDDHDHAGPPVDQSRRRQNRSSKMRVLVRYDANGNEIEEESDGERERRLRERRERIGR